MSMNPVAKIQDPWRKHLEDIGDPIPKWGFSKREDCCSWEQWKAAKNGYTPITTAL